MFALLAGVEVETTLGTLSNRLGNRLQQRPALRTAGDRARSRHVDRPRAKGIVLARRRWLLNLFLRFAAGVLISALPVLTVRQREPPQTASFSAIRTPRTRGLFVAAH